MAAADERLIMATSDSTRDSAALITRLAGGGEPLRRALDRAQVLRLQVVVREVEGLPTGAGAWPMGVVAGGGQGVRIGPAMGFRVDAEYIYPASTVKLPTAVAALMTLAELAERVGRPEIGAASPLRFWPCLPGESVAEVDATNVPSRRITAGHDARRVCVVSDNPAHNRLYGIVGHEEVNRRLWAMGLTTARINHRLAEPGRTWEEHRRTPRVDVLGGDGAAVAELPARESGLMIDNEGVPGLEVGTAHVDPMTGERVEGPLSFLKRNRLGLHDQQAVLMKVLLPGAAAPDEVTRPIGLRESDRLLLCDALWPTPRQSGLVGLSKPGMGPPPDEFVKFMVPGLRRALAGTRADDIAVFNKVGMAYGFFTDNALVVRRGSSRGVLVAGAMYANESAVLGLDTYDEKTVARPVFEAIGEVVGGIIG